MKYSIIASTTPYSNYDVSTITSTPSRVLVSSMAKFIISYTVKADLPVTSNFATNTLYGGKILPARVVGMWRAQCVPPHKNAYTTKMMVEAFFCLNQQIDRCGIFLPLRHIQHTNMPQWLNCTIEVNHSKKYNEANKYESIEIKQFLFY